MGTGCGEDSAAAWQIAVPAARPRRLGGVAAAAVRAEWLARPSPRRAARPRAAAVLAGVGAGLGSAVLLGVAVLTAYYKFKQSFFQGNSQLTFQGTVVRWRSAPLPTLRHGPLARPKNLFARTRS